MQQRPLTRALPGGEYLLWREVPCPSQDTFCNHLLKTGAGLGRGRAVPETRTWSSRWPTAGPELAHSRPTAGTQLAHTWPTAGPQPAHNRHTAGTQPAHTWPTAGTQLAHSWYTAGTQPVHSWSTAGTQPAHSWHTSGTQPAHTPWGSPTRGCSSLTPVHQDGQQTWSMPARDWHPRVRRIRALIAQTPLKNVLPVRGARHRIHVVPASVDSHGLVPGHRAGSGCRAGGGEVQEGWWELMGARLLPSILLCVLYVCVYLGIIIF